MYRTLLVTPALNLVAIVALVGPMLLAAAGVAALLFLVAAGRWPWFLWVIAAPAIYMSWVTLYLGFCAFTVRRLGRRYPKPKHLVMRPGHPVPPEEGRGALTAATCYRHLGIIQQLPLARATGRIPLLRDLWMRAYSPSLHVGNGVISTGYTIDPDLTEVGDNAILGGASSLVAHAFAAREDGALVFTSAPVRIGRRATIGGHALVTLGCVIGEDAVLEQGSVVAPFTRIPDGEVWGGNPAVFIRKRNAAAVSRPTETEAPPVAAAGESSPPPENLAVSSSLPSIPIAALRETVIAALRLSPEDAPEEPGSDNCAEWDSLGQVAIAAALFDRYGIVIDGADVFRVRSLRDLANLVARERPAPSGTEQRGAGGGTATLAATAGGDQRGRASLPDDLEMLPLMDPQAATSALAARFASPVPGAQRLGVRLAASFTIQPVAPTISVWGRAFGFEIDCDFAEYDQIVQALLDPGGPFAGNRGGVNVVLTRPEDLVSEGDGDAARMDRLLDAIGAFTDHREAGGALLVGTLPPVVSAYVDMSERAAGALRDRWASAIQKMPGVEVFDFGRVVEHLGIERARSSQSEALARAPYSPPLYQALGIALVRSIRGTRRAPAKVIVVDCDNTLWGGIVGEAGLDGIQLGPDGPGRSFQLFQRYLKGLQSRGVLLAVASRNEAGDVRDVFEQHPGMVLRPGDVAAWRVNWEPKSDNVISLAEELGLGLDSFVFVDDDPVVRMEVQARLPAVHVAPLPDDPSAYCDTLRRLWLFDGATPTAVDAARTRMVLDERHRQEQRASATSLDEFLAGLGLEVRIAPAGERDLPRVAQLTQRTNQFNLSLKRRTLEEVRAMASPAIVLTAAARDRFGDYGQVGVCILQPTAEAGAWQLETLLMSCRALGRGVEDAFLHGIAAAAVRQGASSLGARYVEGPRNAQVRAFLAMRGFTEVEPNVFRRPLDRLPPLPVHVDLHDRGALDVERPSPSVVMETADAALLRTGVGTDGTPQATSV